MVKQLQPLFNQLLGGSVALASGTLGGLLNLLLVVILSIMFLVEPDQYRRALVRLFPSFYRHRIEVILDRCRESLRGWLVGILFNMLVIGGFSGIGLWILGVKLPLANGIFAGLLTFIPNLGPDYQQMVSSGLWCCLAKQATGLCTLGHPGSLH